jgi:predicted amidophosphoribosyltransferase
MSKRNEVPEEIRRRVREYREKRICLQCDNPLPSFRVRYCSECSARFMEEDSGDE